MQLVKFVNDYEMRLSGFWGVRMRTVCYSNTSYYINKFKNISQQEIRTPSLIFVILHQGCAAKSARTVPFAVASRPVKSLIEEANFAKKSSYNYKKSFKLSD